MKLDISLAKLHHSRWMTRLRLYIDGHQDVIAVSHRDCDLGKWVYTHGMKQYGSLPEMQRLEKTHVDFHRQVKKVVDAKLISADSAEQEYKKLKPVSAQINTLLDNLDQKVN